MSELIQKNDNRVTIRWKLLTGVSALALTAYVSSASIAKSEDTDRPTIWIELGGQMERVQGVSAPFTAPFMTATTPDVFADDIFGKGQKPARFAFGGEGTLSFQPKNSDWIFSAAIRYGRSNTSRHFHEQGPYATAVAPTGFVSHFGLAPFADIKGSQGDHHAILDFSAGKDVGLGAFGRDGTSTISAGVRIADFTSRSGLNIIARPVIHAHPPAVGGFRYEFTFYNYSMAAHAQRSFHGVGPSISWNASAALVGNKQTSELTLDWGINGALLFGRQKAKTSHTTKAYVFPYTAYYHGIYQGYYYTQVYNRPHTANRSHRVTVPNVGGYAGLSWKSEHARVSIGYRYDTFLKAMDTGIDAAKKSNVTFNGPFASISIGLGD